MITDENGVSHCAAAQVVERNNGSIFPKFFS
jgi:hypothetical protein